MSVLGDAVTARDTAGRLVGLTNVTTNTGRAATTVNATTLAAAVADVTAEFATKAGETFDEANAQHIQICVPGVWAILGLWKGQEGGQAAWDRFATACEDYRATRGNKRIRPLTNRALGPTEDLDSDGSARRPEFDRTRFGRLDVEPPPSGDGG